MYQASKSYLCEQTSLENFIFTLRDNVGLNMLVEVVANGKEGHDLLRNVKPCDTFYITSDLPDTQSTLTK